MAYLIVFIIKVYRLILSPLLGQNCRFTPSCSQYAIEALQKYGFLKGVYLALRRLSKCHPWHAGGHDPLH